jgi:RNA polymerase sigma factor (sigma-70 family)
VLQRQIRLLTEDEQELLRLRFWEGLPIAEIARRLDITYSATSVRLFRLLAKLRARLEP